MITQLSPNYLLEWEMNPRKRIDAKSLQPLIDSMRSVGWFGAIMVRPAAEAGLYQVMAGERRWRAALAVGIDVIACEVREMDDKAAIELAVIENRDREDLDVIEEAGGYRAMVDCGWSVAEIASRSGRSEAMIYHKLDLLALDAGTQEALRDGLVTLNTARCLGRIEDEALRGKALERVVKPTYQDTPLSEKQALPMIQREFLDPQKRQKAWDKRCKALRKEHGAEIEIVSVAEAGKFRHSYEYVACENAVPEHELAASAREDEEFEAPTWGALAEKHGARKFAVPDEDGEAEFYVEREPIITAEQVAGEKDPEGCIFPMRGDGRHAQALSREKTFAEQEAERKERRQDAEERQAALVKRIYAGFVGDDRMSLAEQEGVMTRLAVVLAEHNLIEEYAGIAETLGVDLETLGDGNEVKGLAIWLQRLLTGGEPVADVLAMLMLANGVNALWALSDGAEETLGDMEEAMNFEHRTSDVELRKEEEEDEEAWKRMEGKRQDGEVVAAALRALKGNGSIVFQVEGKALLGALGAEGLRATRAYLRSDEMDEQREGYDTKRGKRAAKFLEVLNSLLAAAGG